MRPGSNQYSSAVTRTARIDGTVKVRVGLVSRRRSPRKQPGPPRPWLCWPVARGGRIICARRDPGLPALAACARRRSAARLRLRAGDRGRQAATRTSAGPALLRALQRLPHPRRRGRPGLEARAPGVGRRAHQRPELQRAQGEAATTSSSPSATAASPARSCPRTSSSARTPRRSRDFLDEVLGRRQTSAEQVAAVARSQGDPPRPRGRARAALARRGAAGRDRRAARARRSAGARILPELEELRATQNEASEGIAAAKRAGEDASAAIAEMQRGRRRGEGARGRGRRRSRRSWTGALATVPNLPEPDVPAEGGAR